MENLNAEQAIKELENQTKFAKFTNSTGVLLSAKCAQFCLDHAQYYEQRIKELTEENERLRVENEIKSQKRANIFEIAYAFERGRTDGVQKMQERLKAKAVGFPNYTGEAIAARWVDQIAKEMLEGENDNLQQTKQILLAVDSKEKINGATPID